MVFCLVDGTVGKEYKENIKSRTDLKDVEGLKRLFNEDKDSFPPGLNLNSETGELFGTFKKDGDYYFKVKAVKSDHDEWQTKGTFEVSLKIKPADKEIPVEQVVAIFLPDGTVGQQYKEDIKDIKECRGLKDEKDLKWELVTNSGYPEGFDILAGSGILQGTPKSEGDFHFKITVQKTKDGKAQTFNASLKIKPEDKKVDFELSERLRIIGGYEMIRATSAQGKERAFLDLYFSQPLPFKFNGDGININIKPLHIWGNARFSSAPQASEKTIGALTTDVNTYKSLNDLKLNDISRSGEFLLGFELNLKNIKSKNNKYTIGLIMATGAIKPHSPDKDELEIYKINDDFKQAFPGEDTEGKEYFTFIPPERNRFFKQAYIGFRLKTYQRNKNGLATLPSMFDATWGINEAASGGEGHLFRKSVFRLDGFLTLKLPVIDVPLYIFGTVILNTSKEESRIPFYPEPIGADTQVQIHSPNVLKVALADNDRDYFRIGLGINLMDILKKTNGEKKEEKPAK